MSEGQPMAILEAMSRGMCVVASKAGGIPEMLGDAGGILVEPEDVDALASTLFHVVNDSDARTRYGDGALRGLKMNSISRRLQIASTSFTGVLCSDEKRHEKCLHLHRSSKATRNFAMKCVLLWYWYSG